jgi:DNA-binding HxlR family transcriptional regulator
MEGSGKMSIYGQFCPMAKAVELLGERWTILVIRELMLGSSRFNELQRGLAKMSLSLLTKRLKELEAAHILTRKKISGQKGYSYHLTQSGMELAPMMTELANWGLRWVNSSISQDEIDIEFLMLDFQRNVNYKTAPTNTTIKIHYNDADKFSDWWVIIGDGNTEICGEDTGHEPDVYITCSAVTMMEVWACQIDWQQAQKERGMSIMGNPSLVKELPHWFYRPDVEAGHQEVG